MKKIMVFVLLAMVCSAGFTSKLSKFLNKMDAEQKQRDAEQKQRDARELQQDMNFGDYAFRLKERYVDDRGQRCRDYEFRGRSNPYRHGYFTVCDDR
ncbi:TPA: hypothetical protein JBB06_11885 [Legionella pneumophila subsp. pneumophila]|uniref:hypothetical protein n=1 Tax=Legionella pneumophila TaxID=446 RepID=UPI000875F044|nr:hypothetical protein [Legionella pneumophila]AOW58730.1 hypothetical protein BE843_10920 [Legionella pneumophila subsp. pneumophila]AOW61083.1 hypothetical protein BE844_07845 [Legionella pneumophila subsp. pneumophila]AOW66481.1 hypothetical protein BE846_05605 [Legionella pneumophila subsp. pneumophila]HAT8940200.1 hypothetical protein [Legionella pneumophila subsp. pneumophila]HAT9030147.1 hypothetical protein [Legionella pneumophila subsp. pneumophila]